MKDPEQSAATSPPHKEDPETLVLRGRPRPVVRFRRGLIVGITGAVAISLVSLAWVALEPPRLRTATTPIDSDEQSAKAPPDALVGVPKTYGDVPRLGPPLPGDLGRAILAHERSFGDARVPAAAGEGGEDLAEAADRLRQRKEANEAGRTAALMVQVGKNDPPLPITGREETDPAIPVQSQQAPTGAIVASQQHKIDFARSDDGVLSSHQLSEPRSPWMLSAGTVIPASLVTGLNSDLPGTVIAQVTQNVRDSATERTILIPQGARLIGNYDPLVAYGQRRALLVWTRIVFPDGSSVELDHMPATDAAGYAGVSDRVNSHTWQLVKGVAISTLLGVGAQLSFGAGRSDLVRALRESAQENAARAGDQITSRNLEVQPTITVRPGWPVRALVNKDLILAPWKG
ncbi:MAG TPA: TrbI/VirB10 family protein [Sphingomicrobium sp.]|nr:TrbI/VirB10 family protein [Sphingomicrobium sp.]